MRAAAAVRRGRAGCHRTGGLRIVFLQHFCSCIYLDAENWSPLHAAPLLRDRGGTEECWSQLHRCCTCCTSRKITIHMGATSWSPLHAVPLLLSTAAPRACWHQLHDFIPDASVASAHQQAQARGLAAGLVACCRTGTFLHRSWRHAQSHPLWLHVLCGCRLWLPFELQDPSPIKKKGVREMLASEQGAAAARLSRRLVALQTDVDVPVVRCAPPATAPVSSTEQRDPGRSVGMACASAVFAHTQLVLGIALRTHVFMVWNCTGCRWRSCCCRRPVTAAAQHWRRWGRSSSGSTRGGSPASLAAAAARRAVRQPQPRLGGSGSGTRQGTEWSRTESD